MLENLVQKLSNTYKSVADFVNNEKEYCKSAGLFIATRIFDIATSYMVIAGYGTYDEVGPLTSKLMELSGWNLGLTMEQVLGSIFVLSLTYCLHKKGKKISGINILNAVSIISLGIGISHFFQYFNNPFPIIDSSLPGRYII